MACRGVGVWLRCASLGCTPPSCFPYSSELVALLSTPAPDLKAALPESFNRGSRGSRSSLGGPPTSSVAAGSLAITEHLPDIESMSLFLTHFLPGCSSRRTLEPQRLSGPTVPSSGQQLKLHLHFLGNEWLKRCWKVSCGQQAECARSRTLKLICSSSLNPNPNIIPG